MEVLLFNILDFQGIKAYVVVIKKILYWCVSPELKSTGPSYEPLKVSPTC